VNIVGGWKKLGRERERESKGNIGKYRELEGNQRNFIVLRVGGRQTRRSLGPSL